MTAQHYGALLYCGHCTMAATYYGGAALWWLRTMTALHWRCSMATPLYGGAALWRQLLCRLLYYDGAAVLWRRRTMAGAVL